jgi:ubiquinone/menaquinone biosynthesis C-methylase UbiE
LADRKVDPGSVSTIPPSTLYSTDYFLSGACEGLDEYLAGSVSVVKQRELDLLDVQPGHVVLDLGCGRGESSTELARRGARPVALDYSWDAVKLTQKAFDGSSAVLQGDATALPFPARCFDRVLLGDVIEHLPWNAGLHALAEVQRVLVPGGRALIHTSPNTWFVSTVMRPLRLVLRLLRRHEVLDRFGEYDRLRGEMHPNELNPLTIRRLMREAGVDARTWVDRDVLRSGASEWTAKLATSPMIRLLGKIAGLWPFRLILGNDLYALVIEKSDLSG